MSEITLGDYSKHSSVDDIFNAYANLGELKDFFYHWGGFNEWLFLKINGIRGDYYDAMMVLISKLGDKTLFPLYIACIASFALLSLLLRKLLKKGGVSARLTMWFGILLVLIIGFAVNVAFTHVTKDLFGYPRPYVALANQNIHLLEAPRSIDDGHRSFPSGHVAFITLLIIGLWPAFRDDWKWYSLLLIVVEGWSRISVGMHFPADVLGAATFSTLIVIGVRYAIYTTLRKIFNLVC